jgi:uridylate kinase
VFFVWKVYTVVLMVYEFGRTVVIALGGSIVFPKEGIDSKFLKQFCVLVKKEIARGRRFIIVVGGGSVARVYRDAASAVARVSDEDKDWLGIHATRANAHLLRTIFREEADPVVFDARGKLKRLRHPVTIASGWRPGWSTDYVGVALAEDFGIPEVIMAGKADHVYDKDPARYAQAKRFDALLWKEYRRLIPSKWSPGGHMPVDPVASRLAQQKKISAIITSGKDLRNFRALLSGKAFRGTLIS